MVPASAGATSSTTPIRCFDAEVLDAFDIVGFDPRGTGLSEPAIDCIDDYDHFYAGTDITPDDDAERQQIVDLAEEFADACVANNAEIIQFVGTNNAARDIDSIRRALGEDEISYFGFELRSRARRDVGDDVPDHGAGRRVRRSTRSQRRRAAGGRYGRPRASRTTLTTYLAQCSADPGCAFHNDGDAEGAFDELMLQLDATPIPSVEGRPDDHPWRRPHRRRPGDVRRRRSGPSCPRALRFRPARQRRRPAAAVRRRTSATTATAPGATCLEAFQTISCMDTDERLTVEEDDATAPMFSEVAPRFVPA